MRRLCRDIALRSSELGHVDIDRVAIRFCQTRHRAMHGVQASLTPLRFAGGAIHDERRGRRRRIEPVRDAAGREMLYLLSFYLPRFLDRPFEDKLVTVFHELWHIGPAFDGDLRRHEGRCFAHGASASEYDDRMRGLAANWLASRPPDEIHDFLRLDFATLARRHGAVYGTRLRTPRIVAVET